MCQALGVRVPLLQSYSYERDHQHTAGRGRAHPGDDHQGHPGRSRIQRQRGKRRRGGIEHVGSLQTRCARCRRDDAAPRRL